MTARRAADAAYVAAADANAYAAYVVAYIADAYVAAAAAAGIEARESFWTAAADKLSEFLKAAPMAS